MRCPSRELDPQPDRSGSCLEAGTLTGRANGSLPLRPDYAFTNDSIVAMNLHRSAPFWGQVRGPVIGPPRPERVPQRGGNATRVPGKQEPYLTCYQ